MSVKPQLKIDEMTLDLRSLYTEVKPSSTYSSVSFSAQLTIRSLEEYQSKLYINSQRVKFGPTYAWFPIRQSCRYSPVSTSKSSQQYLVSSFLQQKEYSEEMKLVQSLDNVSTCKLKAWTCSMLARYMLDTLARCLADSGTAIPTETTLEIQLLMTSARYSQSSATQLVNPDQAAERSTKRQKIA